MFVLYLFTYSLYFLISFYLTRQASKDQSYLNVVWNSDMVLLILCNKM